MASGDRQQGEKETRIKADKFCGRVKGKEK